MDFSNFKFNKPIGSTGKPVIGVHCASKKGEPNIPETDDSSRSKMDANNSNQTHKWSVPAALTCGCKLVCVCASKKGVSKEPVADSDSKWESEFERKTRFICLDGVEFVNELTQVATNDHGSHFHVCGKSAPKKEVNKPRISSNFAYCLFEICLLKPHCRQIFEPDINILLGKVMCKEFNAKNINMKYYDIIIELYLTIITKGELGDQDFVHIINTMKSLRPKGLVTDALLIDIEKTIKENGYQPCINALKYFNPMGNKCYAKEYLQLVDNMRSLYDNDKYSDKLFAKLTKPMAMSDVLQSKLNILSSLYCPTVMTHLGILDENRLLTKVYVSKYTKLTNLASSLLDERTKWCEKMKVYPKEIINGLTIIPDGLIELALGDANKDFTGAKVCMSSHKTPFCEMCGLQKAWLKTFKKRGIQIKEANKANNRNIWYNDIKDK